MGVSLANLRSYVIVSRLSVFDNTVHCACAGLHSIFSWLIFNVTEQAHTHLMLSIKSCVLRQYESMFSRSSLKISKKGKQLRMKFGCFGSQLTLLFGMRRVARQEGQGRTQIKGSCLLARSGNLEPRTILLDSHGWTITFYDNEIVKRV